MFSFPFPNSVRYVEVEIRSDISAHLLPDAEASLLHPNASEKRIREFSAGRLAARKALGELGCESSPAILLGTRGEPLWPSGYTGSISHSENLAAALVAKIGEFRSVGIDLQSLRRRVNEEIARRICHPNELAWCLSARDEFQARLMSIFSAKETLFKALYPLAGSVFYFLDARLEIEHLDSCAAFLLKDLSDEFQSGARFEIHFERSSSMIMSHMLIKSE